MATRRQVERLLAEHQPAIRRAFLEAIRDVQSSAQLSVIARALEVGDIEAALSALNIRDEFFAPLDEAMRTAYLKGGADMLALLPKPPGPRLVVRFDGRNARAERWLREVSARRVVEITERQRQNVRAALTEGMAEGRNPRTVALEIVGRQNRQTGRREGGILGLTQQQAGWVQNARQELAFPETMAEYLKREKRDKRFDGAVRRAIREGKRLPSKDVRKIMARYHDRLLKLRGDAIARTEALSSLHAAQHESISQLIERGEVRSDQVTRTWNTASDARVRDTHNGMQGTQAGLNDPFMSPSGAALMYPGDASLGAPAGEIINCRCVVSVKINYLMGL